MKLRKTHASTRLHRNVLAALLIICGHARSQTSAVTVYGYVDISVQRVAGYDSGNVSSYTRARKTAMAQGYRNWLGFSGSEDIGGGWAATFDVQMRFMPDTGAFEEPGGTAFQGESTLGLSSKTAGTLRLGRALTPYWAQKWRYDPWYDSQYMGSVGAYQNGSYNSDPTFSLGYANWARMQQAVFYDSRTIAGFTVHAASQIGRPACVATPTVACNGKASGKVQSITLNYARGPLLSALSYERNMVGDSVDMLGLSYQLGSLTLMGTLGSVRINTVPWRERNGTLAGSYATSSPHTLRIGYGHSNRLAGNGAAGNGGGTPGSTQRKFSLGDSYALSSRVNLYADLWREHIAAVPTAKGMGIGMNLAF